jgi:hypothetical protein
MRRVSAISGSFVLAALVAATGFSHVLAPEGSPSKATYDGAGELVTAVRPLHPAVPRITVRNGTENRQPEQLVAWAVERYEMAGISLPDVVAYFHPYEPTAAHCSGAGGLWSTVGGGRHRVDICAIGEGSRRRTLLHELAHAWTNDNLTVAQRQEFVARRGLQVWIDDEVDWGLLGTEHASVIMTWGLEVLCVPRDMISGDDYESLAADFRFLTGTDPICQHPGG